MENEEIIKTLTNTISELTKVIGYLNKNIKSLPSEVDLDVITKDPFGQLDTTKNQSIEPEVIIKEVPVEVIKEIIKEVEVPVEVPVEVIKEVTKEVEVPVDVIKEIIKEVFVNEKGEKFNSLEELNKNKELEKNKKPKEKIIPRKIIEQKDEKAPDVMDDISKESHIFPDYLFHSNGFKMEKYKGELIYKPNYELTPNQDYFGVQGEWNVVVTYDKAKDRYFTEHPEKQFNAQILYEEKPEKPEKI